jgi:hypothetical protein
MGRVCSPSASNKGISRNKSSNSSQEGRGNRWSGGRMTARRQWFLSAHVTANFSINHQSAYERVIY